MKLFATETEGKEKRIRRLRKYSLLSLPFIVLMSCWFSWLPQHAWWRINWGEEKIGNSLRRFKIWTVSKTYNSGRFYKIVYSWKALDEGDLSFIGGEIVLLKPLLSVDEKEKGRLYGRSSGQEERFPNIGGLLIVRSTHRGILNRKSLGCLGDHHKRSLLIIRKLIVLCSSIFSIVHMFVYVNISYVKCKVNCILFQITICAGVGGGRVSSILI